MDYKTIKSTASVQYIDRRSQFIGYIKPVQTEEEAVAYINEIKAAHRDASHVVYAYVLRRDNTRRYSDAGEPQGTAGIPALEVLLKNELFDLVLVIVRYFGGTLLGAGGLVRAYAHTATISVEAAGIVTMKPAVEAETVLPYSFYELFKDLIMRFDGVISKTEFKDEVFVEFYISKDKYQNFNLQLKDMSKGSILLKIIGESYAKF